jgi:hypothetical protein
MKRLVAAAAAAVLAWSATPATAFVVEVTTSVALADADDQGELKTALQAAVDNVLTDAISFTPTMIVLTHAVLVGDRLYVRLLLADQDGERTFNDLKPDPPTPQPTETTDLQI